MKRSYHSNNNHAQHPYQHRPPRHLAPQMPPMAPFSPSQPLPGYIPLHSGGFSPRGHGNMMGTPPRGNRNMMGTSPRGNINMMGTPPMGNGHMRGNGNARGNNHNMRGTPNSGRRPVQPPGKSQVGSDRTGLVGHGSDPERYKQSKKQGNGKGKSIKVQIDTKDKKSDSTKVTVTVNGSNKSQSEASSSRDIVVIDDISPEKSTKKRKVITIDSEGDESSKACDVPAASSSSNSDPSSKPDENIGDIPQKYIDHLTHAIENYYHENKQDTKCLERKRYLRDAIQQIIGRNIGEGLLHLTGSSMSGFGHLKCDADMALIFDPYINEMPKKKSRNIISRLAGCLRRQAFASNVEMIFAKVPIVKFYDNISGTDVDVNVNNIVGIKNSFLLRSISLLDQRIPSLVIVVKAWAKSHDINSAFQGSLSSYCIVNMIIYFLQIGLSSPILPPLKKYVDKLERVNVNTDLQKLVPRTFIDFNTKNTDPIGIIFTKFFVFWTKKFRQNKIFSPYLGTEKIRNYNEPLLDTSAYVFVIQEPFQKDNIARAVRGQQFQDVKLRFSQAVQQFCDVTNFNELFGRLS